MAATITLDAEQQRAAAKLDALADTIRLWRRRRRFVWRRSSRPRGIYLWGEVGRGKTMLMDRFFDEAEIAPRRRVHFNDFMADFHVHLHALRNEKRDPIPSAAKAVAAEAALLCLDEFEVRDITDAMLLGRLFEQLLARRVIIVVTSNTAPRKLYEDGLNRQLFLPFISLIEQRLDIVHLEGGRDYRLGRMAELNLYVTPLGAQADALVDAAWSRLTDRAPGAPEALTVLGRKIEVPRAAHGVARFSFDELCVRPLAAADYLAIARRYHVLLIDRIPHMDATMRDPARRFAILIDTLYDEDVKLVCSAAAAPRALFSDPDSFRRTTSRLVEMQSTDYIGRGRIPRPGIRPDEPALVE